MIESTEEFIRLRSSADHADYHRAAHDEAPDRVWFDVISRFPEWRFWVAHNKTVPMSVLEVLAKDSDERVRVMVAMKRKLTPELLVVLSQDSAESVRAAVARHRKSSSAVLAELRRDPSSLVREIAVRRLADPETPRTTGFNGNG